MREVYVDQDYARVGFYKSLLDEAGIVSFIRNEHTTHSHGQIGVPLFYPALCVINDEDYEKAMEVLEEFQKTPPTSEPDWVCAECKEEVPANFGTCWKCGASRVTQ